MKEPKEFVKGWCDFSGDRAYVLMGIARKAQNEELTNSTEIVHRRIIESEEDVDFCYPDIKALMDQHGYTYRVYLTANARSLTKALFNYQKRIMDKVEMMYNGHDDSNLSRLGSEWKSEVHSPNVKYSDYFFYDLDDVSQSDTDQFISEIGEYTKVNLCRETPNGFHVITSPYNYQKFNSPVEVDAFETDGMIFVEEVDD